jgi:hydrogenase expression/formation protein HypE
MNDSVPLASPSLSCPVPVDPAARIQLAHGGGGRLMHRLIRDVFLAELGDGDLQYRDDAASLPFKGQRLAFTTDAFVVRPLLFPGGDIGSLAVYGTVNDLATRGAVPLYLSASFILEEGLPVETLRVIVRSMRHAANHAGVRIVTGDTKVVERSNGDGLLICTTGIGSINADLDLSASAVRPGDAIIVSGDIGRHGVSVMTVREGIAFASEIPSDVGPINHTVHHLLDAGVRLRCVRDLTRGGLATAIIEIAETAARGIRLVEDRIPVREDVRGACEILGLDPLYVACEGRFAAFVAEEDAEAALDLLRNEPDGEHAAVIGHVLPATDGTVLLGGILGVDRVLAMLSGEQLPRIC